SLSPSPPSLNMSQATSEVSTARSEQFEEFETTLDAQRRLDSMQPLEEDDGVEAIVEIPSLDKGVELSVSALSTCYAVSATDDSALSFADDLTDDLMSVYGDDERSEIDVECPEPRTDELISIYSDYERSEIEVECPDYFPVSSEGNAVAMDSIEALDMLPDFMPIPVDFTNVKLDSLAEPTVEKAALQSVVEYTAHAGDTDSTTTCPYQACIKDAAITDPKDKADITTYSLAPSQTDVTVVAPDEGLVENEAYSVAKSPLDADMTMYPAEKSMCEVEISEVSLATDDISVYSAILSECCIEMLGRSRISSKEDPIDIADTHSVYSEAPSEVECNL
ncbi:hypothetical protein PMAYCL1PPCAC_03500, partial [Pristionchus mayeri]